MKAQQIQSQDVTALAAAALQYYEHAFEGLKTELVAVLQTQALVEHGKSLGIKVVRTPKEKKRQAYDYGGVAYSSYFKDLVACVVLQEPAETRPQLLLILSKALNLPISLLSAWTKQTLRNSTI